MTTETTVYYVTTCSSQFGIVTGGTLFESGIKEKSKHLSNPPETVHSLDYDVTHEEISSAKRLSELADNRGRESGPGEVQLYARDSNEYVNSFKKSADGRPRDSWHKGRTNKQSHPISLSRIRIVAEEGAVRRL
ncbi:hypothetical protein KIN20_014039 [Parelaphostrongylus tenuis]|uniref:Uncharacterized protein n=1 Tax=Parelaphostrongylus tenuis TaxID=148309 RepID=A0AAD5N2R4_PARTN|nr:hypothetical protein KIN20_014039 [Parelaphostrongylus tenuis]